MLTAMPAAVPPDEGMNRIHKKTAGTKLMRVCALDEPTANDMPAVGLPKKSMFTDSNGIAGRPARIGGNNESCGCWWIWMGARRKQVVGKEYNRSC